MWLARVPRPAAPEYSIHQVLWTYFPERYRADGAKRPFVYRDERVSLLVLSRYRPQCDCRCLNPAIETGRVYQFSLRCSPARGVWVDAGKTRRRREHYRGNAERREWFMRRIAPAARPLFVQVDDRPARRFRKQDGRSVSIEECEIRGTLEVIDRTAMIEQMCAGIGGRGCWGNGLLYLPEVMG